MKKRKELYCFITTIEAWKYVEKKYKDFNKKIYTCSPEILLNNKIKKKIALDERNSKVIKPLSKDLGKLSQKIFKKIRIQGLSYNFAIQYITFLFNFSNVLRFSTIIGNEDLKRNILIVHTRYVNSNIRNTNFSFEKILRYNKKLKIDKLNIINRKFEANFVSPNLILRLILNGYKNFEFLLWKFIWSICPSYLSKGTVLLGLDGFFLRETAVYLSRGGYRFEFLPKKRLKGNEIIKKDFIKKINLINKDVKKIFNKYLTKKLSKITFEVFNEELKFFLKEYFYNKKFWENYLTKKFEKKKIKCLLSTHLIDEAFVGLPDYLIKKKIPIFNFQHGHAREIRHQPEFDKWIYILEALADQTFTYNERYKDRSIIISKLHRGKFTNVGTPTVYKKNKIFFKNPKYEIIFLSSSVFNGLNNRQLPVTLWSDKKKINFELSLIKNVFRKISYNILYKIYPTNGNLSEPILKKEIMKYKNIKFIKKNCDANYFFYSKRIIIIYSVSSSLGWALLSNLPVILINTSEKPIKRELEKEFKKSIFFFNDKDKNFYSELYSFLSQPLNKIYSLWEKKNIYRSKLIKELSSDNVYNAGKLAADQIEKFKY